MKIKYKKINDINCKFFAPKDKIEQILIAVHGFAGDAESSTITEIAKELNNNGILVVAFDLPCHGKDLNSDCIKLSNCFLYFDTVYKEIKKTYKNIPISAFATSFGAFVLLNYINKNNVEFANIILRCPAIFMDTVLIDSILPQHGYSKTDLETCYLNLGFEKPLYVNSNFLKELTENSLLQTVFKNKIYVIQGTLDDVVDVSKNEKFFKNHFCDFELFYIKGADHRFKNDGELSRVIQIVKNIILK